NRKKDGGYYWVDVIITPECHDADKICGYSAIRQDITSKKEVENLTQNLEKKVEEQTKDLKKQLRIVKIAERKQNELFVELADEKNFINTIMDSQENFVITSDGKCLKTANKAFYDFFEVKDTDEFIEKFGNCICDTFDTTAPKEYIQKTMGDEKWLDYVNNRPHQVHKTMIIQNEKEYIFTITSEKLIIKGHELKTAIFTDITKMEKAQKEIEATHKHTRESIEYASMIQGALIPEKGIMESFFKDHFVTWVPKDTVGGDIWLFSQLRHKDECLLFFIDCTGHGVPGAFVTMIVKAIEREIVSNLKKHPEFEISPAIIMGYFNNTMKKLLKQETKDSLSNAGWDGGIIYYNRRTQILKFAGAETPLFYMDENQEFQTVKGTRYSVGYKKCAMDYEYKETIIPVKEGMKFYCTTDGYLDQNGGEKDFPFGKKRFTNIIKEHHKSPMAELQTIFQMQMLEYENTIPNNDRNDDMTVIAFEIGKQSEFKEDISEEIVKYEGVMTQNVIAAAIENIEAKIENMGMMGTVSTITIEYCQNMMNYSKNEEKDSRQIVPAGEIKVQNFNNEYYEIIATNIVSTEDKEKIEPKLIEIQDLDKAGIKKRYRELRKSGQNTHEKGGGIGMYEIAKVSDEIEYEFNAINDDKYYFTMKSVVKTKVIEKRNKVD
ncbi:MAG: SiaB family protein kinase, partial [Campylobacterota bacterium]|nr:SiaB family protein kinase [Campylobacterota bacterium]